jgi:hypothetical protein
MGRGRTLPASEQTAKPSAGEGIYAVCEWFCEGILRFLIKSESAPLGLE